MGYYFQRIRKGDLEKMYSNTTALKYIKQRCEKYLKSTIRMIANELNIFVKPYWTSKTTFGSVLCDFTPNKAGPSIIGPHTPLFDLVSEEIDYLIVSRTISRNFKYKTLSNGKKILIVNILRFRKFIQTFSDKYKRIRLFLVKDLTSEEEDIINDWIDLKHTKKENKKYISPDDIMENLPQNDPQTASRIFTGFMNYYHNQLHTNIPYYEEKLKEFEEKVNNPKISEDELRDELKNNIWIIDFKYQNISQFNLEKEVEVKFGKDKKGYIDLWVSRFKSQRGKDIFIELKLPSSKTIVKQRKRDAIGAQVGRAISQLIHYMESKKEGNRIQFGLVIVGKEPQDFIELFNQYLHNIQVKNYQQLIDECKSIIKVFKVPLSDLNKEETQ